MMRVGFTGTGRGMTAWQARSVGEILRKWDNRSPEFHYGLCYGADDQAARRARRLGYRLVAHPGPDPARRGKVMPDEMREPLPFLERNTNIAQEANVVVATPFGGPEIGEKLRSGTWSTIRRARKFRRPLWIVWPDGSYEIEYPEPEHQQILGMLP